MNYADFRLPLLLHAGSTRSWGRGVRGQGSYPARKGWGSRRVAYGEDLWGAMISYTNLITAALLPTEEFGMLCLGVLL